MISAERQILQLLQQTDYESLRVSQEPNLVPKEFKQVPKESISQLTPIQFPGSKDYRDDSGKSQLQRDIRSLVGQNRNVQLSG